MTSTVPVNNLFCFSHLRWNFVYQRPQHLMSRFGNVARVFFVEEPVFEDTEPMLDVTVHLKPNVTVLVPRLPVETVKPDADDLVADLLTRYITDHNIEPSIFWYYSPMALNFTRRFSPIVTVYDCMDELSGFLFAPPELIGLEAELFIKADIVFTGGNSLYEAKKEKHKNVFAFPSSIDREHFETARHHRGEPVNQSHIAHPRIGFYGVVDERLNLELVDAVAEQRPEWNLVIIGPVVKINPEVLPKRKNIHYLGSQSYNDLPAYLSGWDVAIMPFAKNESTRFISPTKTPEYLAGGKPVVSTSIADVVNDYANAGLVAIADTPNEFISRIEAILSSPPTPEWLQAVDRHLAGISWDKTWNAMMEAISDSLEKKMHQQSKNKSANV